MREIIEETVAIRSPISISGPDGSLEGVFSYDARATAGRGVLVLPPHPSLGGDLKNNVIEGVATVLVQAGFSVLRFNYHGVGRSDGGPDDPLEKIRYWSELLEHDNAEDALADSVAALDWLAAVCSEIHAFGYSYGGLLALRLAAKRVEIRSVAAVGMAVAGHDLGFLPLLTAPVLAIHGDRDFATTVSTVDSVLDGIPSSSRHVVLEGRDHFFRGQEHEVAAIALEFFDNPPERFEPSEASRTARRGAAG